MWARRLAAIEEGGAVDMNRCELCRDELGAHARTHEGTAPWLLLLLLQLSGGREEIDCFLCAVSFLAAAQNRGCCCSSSSSLP